MLTLAEIRALDRKLKARSIRPRVPSMAQVRRHNAKMIKARKPRLCIQPGVPCYHFTRGAKSSLTKQWSVRHGAGVVAGR